MHPHDDVAGDMRVRTVWAESPPMRMGRPRVAGRSRTPDQSHRDETGEPSEHSEATCDALSVIHAGQRDDHAKGKHRETDQARQDLPTAHGTIRIGTVTT